MPRILFLEDEPVLVETLPVLLGERYGNLDVVGLSNTAEALELLSKEVFDVVLLDISMPLTEDMDAQRLRYGRLAGIEVAERIKRMLPDIPIVALTVVTDKEYRKQMAEAGIRRVIHKPAEIDAIAQILLEVTQTG